MDEGADDGTGDCMKMTTVVGLRNGDEAMMCVAGVGRQ